LCERIPLTAERLRNAAFNFAARARWAPAATSLSWRRDALASAITGHGSELILRALPGCAEQLGLEAALRAQLLDAAEDMKHAWKAWRDVTGHWDVITTGAPRGVGMTPVAYEISDLVLRIGRLAYRNPHWTPACSGTSLIRDPADLARSPGDILTVLAALHHAADAISQIAATDHQSVLDTAAGSRLYAPTRLLPDKYDIPHPLRPGPARVHQCAPGRFTTPPSRRPRASQQPWPTSPPPSTRRAVRSPPPAGPRRRPGTTSTASKISSRPPGRESSPRYPAESSRHCANSRSEAQPCSCAPPSSTRPHTTSSPKRKPRRTVATSSPARLPAPHPQFATTVIGPRA
jgi:hypothetical protein